MIKKMILILIKSKKGMKVIPERSQKFLKKLNQKKKNKKKKKKKILKKKIKILLNNSYMNYLQMILRRLLLMQIFLSRNQLQLDLINLMIMEMP